MSRVLVAAVMLVPLAALCQEGVGPHATASAACSRVRANATSETSRAVTRQPCAASQTASAPSPQPTSSARPGARPETSSTSRWLGRPLQIRSDSA